MRNGNTLWVSSLLYQGHSPQVHVGVEFSSQGVHFCKQTGIMASLQGNSLVSGRDLSPEEKPVEFSALP